MKCEGDMGSSKTEIENFFLINFTL